MTDKSKKKSAEKEDKIAEDASESNIQAESVVKDDLAEAQSKAEEYLSMARRLQADFDNYRKRTQKENEEFRKYANEGMVKELLSVIDDLDRALATATEETDLVTGFRGVRKNLMKMLEEKGLKEIPSEGQFDPHVHEAMCTVDGDTDGKIAQVFQKGYTMDGRVIRYAKVIVTKKQEEAK
ncbi:MAG: nucleotide exchange factor GrpE [Candidatus Methanogranum gryphiswaldense]|nr:MAG: nucleotide exchange factor GrpE [Candidatus Methanogranum sp. U3.2.1]